MCSAKGFAEKADFVPLGIITYMVNELIRFTRIRILKELLSVFPVQSVKKNRVHLIFHLALVRLSVGIQLNVHDGILKNYF